MGNYRLFAKFAQVTKLYTMLTRCASWLLVLLALAGMRGEPMAAMETKDTLTFEALFVEGSLAPHRPGAIRMLPNPAQYAELRSEGIVVFDYATGQRVSTLLSRADLPEAARDFEDFELTPDENLLLLATNIVPIYRRSSYRKYWLYDRTTKALTPLAEGAQQRIATFSLKGEQVAYVEGNNLWLFDIASSTRKQLTRDGAWNKVINGAADWVYEEEFALDQGYRWSPSGRYLAYWRFDESQVKEFTMPIVGSGCYPTLYSYKYPKAGEKNSLVSVHIYDLLTGRTVQVDVGPEPDQYIPRLVWSPREELAVVRMNRLQNQLDVLLAAPQEGTTQVIYHEQEAQYIEQPEDWYLTFLPDGKRFIVPSERDGYRHLYLHTVGSTRCVQLTSGPDELVEVYGYDSQRKRVLFQGYCGPLDKAVYAVDLKGKRKQLLSPREGISDAAFNADFSYYQLYHSSAQEPLEVTVCNADGATCWVQERNEELRHRLNELALPTKRFFTFTQPTGLILNGYQLLPPDFDSTRRYPVLLYQYSGPNSQQVLNRWTLGWNEYLASKGCIVVCVDGRGTGGRGEEFRKCTYGKLGDLESQDQIAAARYLATLPYVDPARMGIWGWSYGGYMSSLALLRGEGVFRMAIAVAPVTNWRFYDSIYTERFMGLPQDNAEGYDSNAPLYFADRLKGSLLLVHGTADDNVHYQNSLALAAQLIAHGKDFDMLSYPDRNHGIYGHGATAHLYHHLTRYVRQHLLME